MCVCYVVSAFANSLPFLPSFPPHNHTGSLPHVNCRCSSDIVTTFVLGSNFIWLLFARPLLTLLALLQQQQQRNILDADSSAQAQPNHNSIDSSSQSLPLDLCAHLLLFLLAAVLPFSTQFGLLACCNQRKEEEDEALEFDIETSAQASISAALKSQILGLSSAATVPHQHQLTGRPAY